MMGPVHAQRSQDKESRKHGEACLEDGDETAPHPEQTAAAPQGDPKEVEGHQ
jgi:hypothetical protein